MAKTFYIDFSGYCRIKAETKEEAEQKFWQGLQVPSKDTYDDVYDIEGIEEVDEAQDVIFGKAD